MNTLCKLIIFLALSTAVSGCYKSYEEDNTVVVTDIPEVIIDHNLIGQVYNDQSLLVNDFLVTYDNQTKSINSKDYFFFEATKVNKYYEKLSITSGDISFPYFIPLLENQTNFAKYYIPSEINETTINSSEKGLISNDEVSIIIDANSYNSNGEVASGSLSLTSAFMNYTSNGHYPGGLIVMDNLGELSLLQPKSYIYISSDDFNLFEGELNSNDQNLYYLNDTKGIWTKLSNSDQPNYTIQNTGWYALGQNIKYGIVKGSITQNQTQLNGGILNNRSGGINYFVQTTDNGSFLTYASLGEEMTLSLSSECQDESKNFIIQEKNNSFGIQNYEIDDINTYIIKGALKDCTNNAIEKSIMKITLDNNEVLIKYITDNDFLIPINNCQEIENIKLESEQANGEATSQTLTYKTNDTIDVFQIHVCETLDDEYFSINIDGELDKFLTKGEAVMEGGRIRINFYDEIDPTIKMSFLTNMERKDLYEDEDLNIIFEAPELGNTGFELQCGSSTKGCGFDRFVITEYGNKEGDFIRGYYQGLFWVKTFKPITKAGYKHMEGVFHVRRTF